MLASSSGGVFEPRTMHMPYLFSVQCMLTDSFFTRVSHVIVMMILSPFVRSKSRIGHRVHIAHTLQTWQRSVAASCVLPVPPVIAIEWGVSERVVELVGGRDAKSRVEDSL